MDGAAVVAPDELAGPDVPGDVPYHECLVIGAGLCGIYQLYRLRELGVDVHVVDRNGGPGGTWFQNRYPGCRFDSESYSYGYSFSKELLEEWDWSEHFSPQPETLRYLEHVTERFDLREDMQFQCTVTSADWDEDTSTWVVGLDDGRRVRCRYVLAAIGMLSTPTMPRYPGMDSFRGPSFHTYDWPHAPLDLAGKRVAVIGTGATAVQLIPMVAEAAEELTVFQRRPNWCVPLRNRTITPDEMADIRARYDEIFARCAETPGGFIHGPDRRVFQDVPVEERYEFWERLYAAPGFEKWVGNFREVLMDEEVNAEFSAFIADKIRERVDDPVLAEKLIPRDHGFGVQRVPLETNYYEAFNRPNVHLVELEETPVVEITPDGVRTTDQERAFDVIVYATGFDAITGAFDRIDITGVGGVRLRDLWDLGPSTYLGVFVHGFPNFVMLTGPQGVSASTNFGRAIEYSADWSTRLYEYMTEHGYTRVEADADAQAAWVEQVKGFYSVLLLRKAKSWFTGYNENLEGHDIMRYLMYNGGAPKYRKTLDAIVADGYPGLTFA